MTFNNITYEFVSTRWEAILQGGDVGVASSLVRLLPPFEPFYH